jgi:D-tyrosyl-tRNA(Tyr) deacylase
MKAVVQRVASAEVCVDGHAVGTIGPGLLVLVAAHRNDTEAQAIKLADRVLGLRIFNDVDGKMNLSLAEIENGGVLAISNFTIYGETAKNRRPSFVQAAPFDEGKLLFDAFVAALKERHSNVEEGIFGADMKVSLLNDGPVTVILDVPPG